MQTQTPWKIAQQEFECSHDSTEIRYQVTSNGVRQYYEQCLDCGCRIGTAIGHDKIKDPDAIVQFDEVLKDNYDYQIRQRSNEIRLDSYLEENQDFWTKYDEYMKSDKWRAKRKLVLKRDNYLCQACLLRTAQQVHHTTYDHVFNEPLFELQSVCIPCHETITKLDRERRQNGHKTN